MSHALVVTEWFDAEDLPGGHPAACVAVQADCSREPAVAAMLRRGTAGPVRLSDVVDVAQFRATSAFRYFHAHPPGTRFAAGAALRRTSDELVLLGLHERERDFDATAMSLLGAIQAVIAPALEMRRRLTLLADTPIPEPQDHGPRGERAEEYWPTPREQDVLELVVTGLTNAQVARRLAISERTVRKHLDSVFRHTNTPGRAAAAAWWQRHNA